MNNNNNIINNSSNYYYCCWKNIIIIVKVITIDISHCIGYKYLFSAKINELKLSTIIIIFFQQQ